MPELPMKKVYSTGEVAAICNVSQQTIIRCFDSGLIRGFRVPGSRFRRVPHDELVRFMKAGGMADAIPENTTPRLLVVTNDEAIVSAASAIAGHNNRFDLRHAADTFDAGVSLNERYPDYVIVDFTMPGMDPLQFAHAVRPNGLTKSRGIWAIDAPNRQPIEMAEAGFTTSLRRPLTDDELRSSIASYLQN